MDLKINNKSEVDELQSYKKPKSATNVVNDFAAFLFPCFAFIELSIGGRLFGTEVLLLVAIPFLIASRGNKIFTPLPRKLLILTGLWFLSQMVTDVIVDSASVDFSRGWARIIFFATNFIGIYLLIDGSSKRIILFAIGSEISQIIRFFTSPSESALEYPWKFGYGSSLTILIILSTQLNIVKKNPLASGAIFIFTGILNFYYDFRSLALACFMSVIFIVTQPIYEAAQKTKSIKIQKKSKKQFSWVSISAITAISLVLVYSLITLYSAAASSGILGEAAKTKYATQSSGQFGLLLGGRTEIFASSVAIADSPIIGHGSWAKDPKYTAILEENITEYGYERTGEEYNDTGQIPSHSYILGAWIESGFFGTFIWFWLLSLTFRLIILLYKANKDPFLPVVVFFCFSLFWNIIFSPFGATARIQAAFYIAIVIAQSIEYRKNETLLNKDQ